MIKINYDKNADAAYIYFTEFPVEIIEKTYSCDPHEVSGMINLDFNAGKLVGIEIMDASKKLPPEVINSAIRIDK
jgi:uncharacterized protein YuzE